jgi:uncharacterized delta-60 repeat protein
MIIKPQSIMLCITSLVAMTLRVHCTAGDIDFTSFGISGFFGTNLSRNDFITSCTVDINDKIVVVGAADGFQTRIGVARILADGSNIDTTFNTIGYEFIPLGNASQAQAVTLLTDNTIVLTGYATQSQTNIPFIRLNSDGSTNVSTTLSVSNGGQGNAVVQQPDGKIIIGGFGVSGQANFALLRCDVNGNPDTNFGTNGQVFTSIGYYAVINSIALQSNGQIVAGGVSLDGSGQYTWTLARYNSDGSPDTNFGSNGDGTVTTIIGNGTGQINAITIQSNGYIVAAGYAIDNDGITKFALTRYDTTGTLDSSFGSGGIVLTQARYQAEANCVILQPDGKILVGGFSFGDLSTDFALARYNTDGSLDAGFGTNGISYANPGVHNSNSAITSLALQSTGKIIAAGYTDTGFTVARFLGA